MDRKKKKRTRKASRKYAPKVKLPLPFDDAVTGLLAVKPRKKKSG